MDTRGCAPPGDGSACLAAPLSPLLVEIGHLQHLQEMAGVLPPPLGLLDILVFLKASGQTGIKKLFMSLATSVCLSRASLVKVTPTPASWWYKFHNQKGKADFAIVQPAVLSMLSPGMGRRECPGSIMTDGR